MQTPSEILADNGPISGLMDGFASRPQQIEMAEAILAAMNSDTSFICEAGTGTGKTYAYLVPAILSGRKVIISTGTRHLQDQLYRRDLPIVQQAIGIPVNIALLKGRANYLCLHRLAVSETDASHHGKDISGNLHDVRLWSQQTDTGDLAELTQLPDDPSLLANFTSTTENCLGQSCDFYDDCFVFRARRRAYESDLVIVNHHLFFADMALRDQGYGELLSAADTVIFDEAHQLPELASLFFSQTLSSYQMLELIRDCRAAYFAEVADLPELLDLLDLFEKSIKDLRLAFSLSENRIAWHRVKDTGDVNEQFTNLENKLYDLHQVLSSIESRGKSMASCYKRADNVMTMLEYFSERADADYIQWLEVRGQGFLLHQTPLNISASYNNCLAEYHCHCIYTSATLTVNGKFNHFIAQLGLEDIATRTWLSPFNFQKQALLFLPEQLPDPRTENYTIEVVDTVIPILNLTRGRAFFLFTSHRALNIAAELIRDKIDYPVLVQGEAPKTELLQGFRESVHTVLLGTSSFWEGVDVKGQALSCVIIDKLPFAAPDDPVLQARMEKLQEKGGNPFMEHQLPEAVINLKQGIGRLIRDENDYGVLVICDPRLKTKSYGKSFLKSLPVMKQTNSLNDVAEFFEEFEQ